MRSSNFYHRAFRKLQKLYEISPDLLSINENKVILTYHMMPIILDSVTDRSWV